MAIRLLSGETVDGDATFSGDIISNGSSKSIKTFRRWYMDGNADFGINNAGGSSVLYISGGGTPATSLATFAGTVLIDGLSNYTGLEVKGSGASRPAVNFTNATQGNLGRIYGTEGNALVLASGSSNATTLTLDSSNNATFAGDVSLADGKKLHFGDPSPNGDLQIYHEAGGNSYIAESGEGALVFKSDNYYFQDAGATATTMQIVANTGVTITGTIDANIAASGNNVIGTLNNTDYTSNNRSALKIRQQADAGGSWSAFLGANQDGTVFLSNDSITADHLTMDSSGNTTFAGNVTLAATKTLKYADDKIKIGGASNTPGAQGIQIGYAADSSGAQGIGIGYAANATGDQSLAMGYNPTASGTYSQAFGYNVTASGSGTVVFGTSGSSSLADTFVLSGINFVIGSEKTMWSGSYGGALQIKGDNATSDRWIKLFTVDSAGAVANDDVLVVRGDKVGIGTDNPGYDFEVRVNDTSNEPMAVFRQLGTGDATIGFQTAAANNWTIGTDNGMNDNFFIAEGLDGADTKMCVTTSGNVGIGNTGVIGSKLSINGGSLADSTISFGLGISGDLTTGRSGTYQTGTLASLHNYYDASSIEMITGSSTGYYCGITMSGRSATSYGDTVRLFTHGVMHVTVDGDGHMGLLEGSVTTIPTNYDKTLLVYTAGTGSSLRLCDGNTGTGLGDGGEIIQYSTDLYVYNREAGNVFIGTSNTERITITSDGNVGIGTTNPISKLDIQGNNFDAFRFSDVDDNEAIGFFFQANSGSGKLFLCTNSDYDAAFTASDAKVTFQNNGNVGIGTTSPDAKVDALSTDAYDVTSHGVKAGRMQYSWYIGKYFSNSDAYVHMKTDLWMGAAPTGNTEYLMGGFTAKSFSYSADGYGEGSCMFHNWAGSFPNLNVTNRGDWATFMQSPYTSTDGYCVIVLRHDYYSSPIIDFQQSYTGYPWRQVAVTASTTSANATGVY